MVSYQVWDLPQAQLQRKINKCPDFVKICSSFMTSEYFEYMTYGKPMQEADMELVYSNKLLAQNAR